MWDNFKRCNLFMIGILKGKERKNGAEEIFEVIMAASFPKYRKQIKDPGSSEYTKKDKYQK